ncbi:unnamed protein product [Prunus armeniaca]|uniref:Uncharacterized protein n=1 Tax=Prunus armeniaca TaxID=36596 RepID=A0A6J5WL64_PRUAR|nr:unnamed protein product [Prunus armeniaca]
MNIVRILDLLGPKLRVAIAYLLLYRECVKAGGCLVSQRLRGQLVEAVTRLGDGILDCTYFGFDLERNHQQRCSYMHDNAKEY